MSEDNSFSIGNLVSTIWDVLCMFFLPHLIGGIFNSLFIPWNGRQTLDYIVGQIFAFQVYITTECVALIGASICVVSATIHLILFTMKKKPFARIYGLIRNISAATVIASMAVGFYSIGKSGPWFN